SVRAGARGGRTRLRAHVPGGSGLHRRGAPDGPRHAVRRLRRARGTARQHRHREVAGLGLRPGPWLQRVRGPPAADTDTVDVGGEVRGLAELQAPLLVVAAGDWVASLTDFRLDEAAQERLAEAMRGVGTVVCESQYRHADEELARRNYHMTGTQAANLARRAGVGRLVLFHLSAATGPRSGGRRCG